MAKGKPVKKPRTVGQLEKRLTKRARHLGLPVGLRPMIVDEWGRDVRSDFKLR
jgi:hypothetical protein